MGYKCSFLDNEIYGADDISDIFSRLTTSGVLPYTQTSTVADALNKLNAQIVSSGVTDFDECAVSYDGQNVTIGQGTIFFESGVSMIIDSEGIVLEYAQNDAPVYVSVVYEETFNRAYAQITDAAPEGDCVQLARISADGSVIDARRFAQAKINLNSANVYFDFSLTINSGTSNRDESNFEYHQILPHANYKYLLLQAWQCDAMQLKPATMIVDISEEGEYTVSIGTSITRELHIRRIGNKLSFYCYGLNAKQEYQFTVV